MGMATKDNLKLSWASQGVLQLHKGRGKKKELIGEIKGVTHKYLCETKERKIGGYHFNYHADPMIISLADYELWDVLIYADHSHNMALE